MCGITGIFNLDGDPVCGLDLDKMTEAIAHRGPDGEGTHLEAFVGLGHRRLAIIDLTSAGRQPMQSADKAYVISYNGEVYNFQQLRIELEKRGHSFRSRTDSEVVLNAYAQWGLDAIHRFNGMFAFALWDRKQQALLLVRDRYGIKPLYYTILGQTILFASEIKALLSHPACDRELDREALAEYFAFQNLYSSRTWFKGVRLLPSGTYLRFSRRQSRIPIPVRYWDFSFSEPSVPENDRAYLEELERLTKQAVTRQLVSDVEVGAYLSGGLDSGTVTAFAAPQMPGLKTFTCGFDTQGVNRSEHPFDERGRAEIVSRRFNTDHHQMEITSGDMHRAMGALTMHLEEPRMGQSYPNFYAAQLASRWVKVCLSGTGGDELFAGYPWRYQAALTAENSGAFLDAYAAGWQRLIPHESRRQVLRPIWKDIQHVNPHAILSNVFPGRLDAAKRPQDYLNLCLYFETKTFLHGLLMVEDKLSMAHGLETRLPMLDNDLVDFAMGLPARLKLSQFRQGPGADGKLGLRRVMAKHLPRAITKAPKQGFSGPDASWFRSCSREFVRRTVLDRRARIFNFLDYEAILTLVDDHFQGGQNRRLLIWSLLSFEWWLKTFLEND